MKDLLSYLVENITGTKSFEVSEGDEDGKTLMTITADPNIIGLIIGKEGKTIKNLRRILSIRGSLEKKVVNISIIER